MSTENIRELVLSEAQAKKLAYGRLVVLGALALKLGATKKDGSTELRLSKADLNRLDGMSVEARELKSGGVVLTVSEAKE